MSTHYRPTLLLHCCRLMLLCLLSLALQPLTARSAQSAATRYVDEPTGNNNGDCTGQSAPCKTIQYAVNQAQNGDTILVTGSANGTHYTYSSATEVCTDRIGVTGVVCFINKQLTLLGGYALDNWATANPAANLTIIDGENRIRGVMLLNFRSTTTLHIEGFTIQNGLARGNPKGNGDDKIFAFGGGMLLDGIQTALLRNMIFQDNQAVAEDTTSGYGGAAGGGGLAIRAVPSATLENILFTSNQAKGGSGPVRGGYGQGGGLFTYQSTLSGSGLTFKNNDAIGGNSTGDGVTPDGQRADALGGGANFEVGSKVTLQLVYMTGNRAIGGNARANSGGGFGGGINAEQTTLTLSDANLRQNVAQGGQAQNGWLGSGGGMATIESAITLERSSIINNSAIGGAGTTGDKGAAGGGGVVVGRINPSLNVALTIINCIIADNVAAAGNGTVFRGGGAGGLWIQGIDATVNHTTIANNKIDDGMDGQGILLIEAGSQGANATIANSVIANHTGHSSKLAALHVKVGNTVTLQGGLWSGNDLDTNASGTPGPAGSFNGLATMKSGQAAFVAPGSPAYNYHLARTSAAIDQATGSTLTVDIENQPRLNTPDYGADEFLLLDHFIMLPLIRR